MRTRKEPKRSRKKNRHEAPRGRSFQWYHFHLLNRAANEKTPSCFSLRSLCVSFGCYVLKFGQKMGGAVKAIEQSKRGGGDHSSRAAQLQARMKEQKALALWLKGATFEQIAGAGLGITTASGAWRAVRRALARIPKQEADQARQAQLARLQEIRLALWNHAASDPIRAAEALIKLEAREARLLGLDLPVKPALADYEDDRIPLAALRSLMERSQRARAVGAEIAARRLAADGSVAEAENASEDPAAGSERPTIAIEDLRRAGRSGSSDD
jgi:hypothetical protein